MTRTLTTLLTATAALLVARGCLVTFEDYPVASADGSAGSSAGGGAGSSWGSGGSSSDAETDVSTGASGGGTGDGFPPCDAGICVPSVPPGWSPPLAFYYGSAPRPECPPGYVLSYDGVAELAAPNECEACSCTGSCEASIAIDTDATCANPTAAVSFSVGCTQSVTLNPRALTATSSSACVASIVAPKPVAWLKQTRDCIPAAATSCESGSCVPALAAPFALCSWISGDVSCPLEYPNKFVLPTDVSDGRTCSACSCAPASGTCLGTIVASSDPGCAQATYGSCLTDSACCPLTGAPSSIYVGVSFDPAPPCAASGGGTISGTAVATNLFTYCCL